MSQYATVAVTCRCYGQVRIPEGLAIPDSADSPDAPAFKKAIENAIADMCPADFSPEAIDDTGVYVLDVDDQTVEIELDDVE